ncbi:hypothetical protein PYCC9005_004489 [Savitreella phatthalungensis]
MVPPRFVIPPPKKRRVDEAIVDDDGVSAGTPRRSGVRDNGGSGGRPSMLTPRFIIPPKAPSTAPAAVTGRSHSIRKPPRFVVPGSARTSHATPDFRDIDAVDDDDDDDLQTLKVAAGIEHNPFDVSEDVDEPESVKEDHSTGETSLGLRLLRAATDSPLRRQTSPSDLMTPSSLLRKIRRVDGGDAAMRPGSAGRPGSGSAGLIPVDWSPSKRQTRNAQQNLRFLPGGLAEQAALWAYEAVSDRRERERESTKKSAKSSTTMS